MKTPADGWYENTRGGYHGEISEVTKGNTVLPCCPKCHAKLGFDELKPVKDQDGYLQYLKGKHACGAELTLFND